jgi:ADP-dependent NAD(P)H-hydrate dehydratase
MNPMPPSPRAESRLDAAMLRSWPLPRADDGDKHDRGTVLVVGGSERTPGAVILSGIAALRVGAGRLQIATAAPVAPLVAVAVPEALVVPFGALADHVGLADAVVVGPGLLDPQQTEQLLSVVLGGVAPAVPVVVDAGALHVLADVRQHAPASEHRQLVLTPNRDELAALVDGGDHGLPELAAAARHGATVVSFGKVATADGRCWCDPTEVRGLGTSGSGDVLAGTVGGLAARCGDATQAACWAAVAHRGAGARLADRLAPVGYLARELADELVPTMRAIIAGTVVD